MGEIRVTAKSAVVFLYFLHGHNRTQHTAPFYSNGFLIGYLCIFFLCISVFHPCIFRVYPCCTMCNVQWIFTRPQSHWAQLTQRCTFFSFEFYNWSSMSVYPKTKDQYKDNPRDLWHLRHWLQFWQLRTWIHDNLCDLTINCDTGQHSQFLRCFWTLPSSSENKLWYTFLKTEIQFDKSFTNSLNTCDPGDTG